LTIAVPAGGLRRDGLVVRVPTLDDVDTLHRAFNDREILELGDFPFDPPSRDGVRQMVSETLPALREDGLVALVVTAAERGEVLGGAALHHVDLERSIGEVGYWLLPEARGRGVATRVARIVAEWGFEVGLARIEAQTFVENAASQRVLERAGFTREGLLRSMPRTRGGRGDMVLFSLLPGE
jgi:RimJ/RimL family protein N-acetyltransferase